VIDAPPDVVWQAVRAPRPPADPGESYTILSADRVPGTPPRQAGEMRYAVVRHADGRLSASASTLREIEEGRSALTQRLEPPHFEMQYLVAPAGRGTRLELTLRWPDAPVTDEGEQLRSRLTQAVRQTAGAYQAAIG
jgi:hypothetical protein